MEFRSNIQFIRSQYLKGVITLDDAKASIKPMLEIMNERGVKIAKEHGKKFSKLTFGYVFR